MENNQSVQAIEKEITIYARIGDMEGLNQANRIEKHEQAEGEFATGQRCRIRVVESHNEEGETEIKYFFTIKAKDKETDDGVASYIETTVEVDKSFALAFVKAGAQRLSSKTRYVFTSSEVVLTVGDVQHSIPNIVYEVDVYNKIDGSGVSEWAKIDIEVDVIEAYVKEHFEDVEGTQYTIKISHLPFKPTDGIMIFNATEEQKEFVDQLYETQWVKKINQDKESVATEGIVDVVKNMFDKITDKEGKRREGQELIEKGKLKEVKAYLEKFYLNEDWLNRQTMVTEPIAAKGIVELITYHGVFDEDNFLKNIKKGIKEHHDVTTEFNKYLKEHSNKVKAIDVETRKLVKRLNNSDPDFSDKIDKILSMAIDQIKMIPSPTEIIEKKKYIAIGETTPFSGNSRLSSALGVYRSPPMPSKINPLDKSDILKISSFVLDILNMDIPEVSGSWSDHSDGDSFWEIIDESGYSDDYARMVYHQSVEQSLNLDEYPYEGLLKRRIVLALVTWMYRSIK